MMITIQYYSIPVNFRAPGCLTACVLHCERARRSSLDLTTSWSEMPSRESSVLLGARAQSHCRAGPMGPQLFFFFLALFGLC